MGSAPLLSWGSDQWHYMWRSSCGQKLAEMAGGAAAHVRARSEATDEYQEREQVGARAVLQDDVRDVLPRLAKARRRRALLIVHAIHLRAGASVGCARTRAHTLWTSSIPAAARSRLRTFMMLGCTSFENVISPLSSLILPCTRGENRHASPPLPSANPPQHVYESQTPRVTTPSTVGLRGAHAEAGRLHRPV